MSPAEGMVFAVGALIVLGTLLLAIQTVVVPRAERSLVVRFVYVGVGLLFSMFARRRKSYEARDALLARYAPTTLMLLPMVWAAGVIYGFSLMFWALDVRPYREALVLSGWSLTTLGYWVATDLFTQVLVVAEALIGLGIVALLISFLPVMRLFALKLGRGVRIFVAGWVWPGFVRRQAGFGVGSWRSCGSLWLSV